MDDRILVIEVTLTVPVRRYSGGAALQALNLC
jgi:hypothetical protein